MNSDVRLLKNWPPNGMNLNCSINSLDKVVHGCLGVARHIHQSLQMLSPPDGKDHLGIYIKFISLTMQHLKRGN